MIWGIVSQHVGGLAAKRLDWRKNSNWLMITFMMTEHGLMTEFFWNRVCELGQTKQYKSPCIWHRQQTSCYSKMKTRRSCYEGQHTEIEQPEFPEKPIHRFLWCNKSNINQSNDLNDMHDPWRHERREMMTIALIILVAKWLEKAPCFVSAN